MKNKRKIGNRITPKPQQYFGICYNKGKDNKDYYNSNGRICSSTRWSVRVPSLKANKKTWENFYKLFPHIKERLANPDNYKEENPDRLILEENVIVEKLVRYRTVNEKTVEVKKTRKYKKIW